MQCKNQKYDEEKQVWRDCGVCINCRINQREEWAVRLTHELKYFNTASFVTLTYSDENLPDNCSIRMKDLSNYFHYLRRDERLKNREIKYFACGEYGDKGGQVLAGRYAGLMIHRPHYHSIIYGLDPFDDNDRKIISDNWQKCEPYIFNKKLGLHGEWLDGQAIDYVTPDNINYTCGYIEKKLIGFKLDEVYTSQGLEPPSSVCSQGLGKRYCMEHMQQILDLCYVQRKGHVLPIPRQYKKWLGIDNCALFAPYLAAKEERHQNEKVCKSSELYNFDKIYDKALEEVYKQFPDIDVRLKNIESSRYSKAADHMFWRIVSREVERQAELAYQGAY